MAGAAYCENVVLISDGASPTSGDNLMEFYRGSGWVRDALVAGENWARLAPRSICQQPLHEGTALLGIKRGSLD